MTMIRKVICPEIKVVDEKEAIVEYVASDETLDLDGEVVLIKGWRFDSTFTKNAPFLDSHQSHGIHHLLGKVVEYGVSKGRLIESVKWAVDVQENAMARLGYAMTAAGYLKAVSVGFQPIKAVTRYDSDLTKYRAQIQKLGYEEGEGPRVVYQEQQQFELSAVILGANPNALAKAYKAGVVDDAGLELFSTEHSKRTSRDEATEVEHAKSLIAQRRERFLLKLHTLVRKL